MIYLGSDPVGVNLAKATDVQINGTSITTDGAANIPIAGADDLGVSKVMSSNGIGLDANKRLYIVNANASVIKGGTNEIRPITPSVQDQSVFYGLAKIAGADMASSNNNPGEYTEDAKVKIQKMLGIYEAPWELIREDTFTNATEADHIITVDGNGNAFELTDLIMWFETPKQETFSKKGYYGQIHFYINNDDSLYMAPEPGSWEQQANGYSTGFIVLADQKDGMMRFASTAKTTNTNSAALRYRYLELTSLTYERISGVFLVSDFVQTGKCYFTKINIKSVTGTGHYKLYGKRKWT